ncbi:phosphate/phosphite/phosphonate ABC transporter substrate-binding protein [Roseomonas sp. PWR1]|uniref:Phosphate/phosphite/phosphonate ABC transporter substrate-binding protein n=1 Tax=Roseomonas nitratireducens TaxID=2820810 RepID=A0ABS4AMD3_9PROT|nr:phosphate/phosphite/phosphonate ABC transporter substrate-binding protein [Neoroseomonas nitratireducens]MBP0462516.1 phosphate/phosphite/phosphonate ABC transporter substrate-binding protein [Neoroseomonas nitratireducens]
MIARRTALALPALGLLPRPAAAQADWRATLREVRFGMISVENERDAIARLQGVQAYMARELGVPFRVFRGSDYAAVVEAMRSGHAELAYLGPASYGLARRVMGDRVAPIFRYLDNEGMEGYHSVMVVKADSPFRRLEDLRGRSLGFSDPNSTSGFQVPGWFLRRQGMDPATFFARTGFAGSHEQNVMAVINGTFDAAVVAYSNERRNTFQRMVEKGMIPEGQVRVIWTSPLIPNSPIVLRMDLPEAFRRDVTAALAALPERDAPAFRDMSSNARGLVPAKHEDYLDIMAILEENAARRRERRS